LVPHPISLVGLRCAIALTFAAAIWVVRQPNVVDASKYAALASALIVLLVVLHAETGHFCINGPAYPNERRFLLRPSAPIFVIAPISASLVAASVALGPLLLASKRWVLGIVAILVGAGMVYLFSRSLYAQAQRFVVFVPAGFVLHDTVVLREPVLFRKQVVERIGPAEANTDALDFTANAPGLAIEFGLTEKVEVTKRNGPRDAIGETGRTARFITVPTLPGRLISEARQRRYAVT
jgi:hypothetical protein